MSEIIIANGAEVVNLAYGSKIVKDQFVSHFDSNKDNILTGLSEILSGLKNI